MHTNKALFTIWLLGIFFVDSKTPAKLMLTSLFCFFVGIFYKDTFKMNKFLPLTLLLLGWVAKFHSQSQQSTWFATC